VPALAKKDKEAPKESSDKEKFQVPRQSISGKGPLGDADSKATVAATSASASVN